MIGVTLAEAVGIIRQIAFATVGAAALWSLFVSTRALQRTLEVAGLVGIIAWIALGWINPEIVLAHEGVSLLPVRSEFLAARSITGPLVALFAATLFAGRWIKKRNVLYLLQFVVVSIIVSFTYWTGQFDVRQLFHLLHGWHSILTIGTVICVDVLLFSKTPGAINFFPMMSRVIWTGLAVDFASVFLILPGALAFTPRFFAAQTIVSFIILNGVLLSGILTKKIITAARQGRSLAPRWRSVATFSGVVSIISWTSITSLDAFVHLQLSYAAIMIIYATVIIIGYCCITLGRRFSNHFSL